MLRALPIVFLALLDIHPYAHSQKNECPDRTFVVGVRDTKGKPATITNGDSIRAKVDGKTVDVVSIPEKQLPREYSSYGTLAAA